MAKDIYSTHAVRLGFRKIKGLSERDAKRIVAARHCTAMASTRTQRLPYKSIRDLWLRTRLSPRIIERLADADAFGSLGLTRRPAFWGGTALAPRGGTRG